MHSVNRPASAATDVAEFITDLDGGVFDTILSTALSQVASATIDHQKVGEVTIKIKMEAIKGTHQVRLQHDVKFSKPTSMGKTSEETSSATVMYVGKYGALSLAQPSLLEKAKQTSFPE